MQLYTLQRVIKDILTGLEYIHGEGVAHCDLKPDNFLFENEADDAKIVSRSFE